MRADPANDRGTHGSCVPHTRLLVANAVQSPLRDTRGTAFNTDTHRAVHKIDTA